MTVQVNPLPIVSTINTEICSGNTVDLTSLVNTQEHTSNQYFTTEADAQAGTSELNSTTISPGTSTSVYVLTTDTNPATTTSCTVINEIQIQVNPLPIVALTNTEICLVIRLNSPIK